MTQVPQSVCAQGLASVTKWVWPQADPAAINKVVAEFEKFGIVEAREAAALARDPDDEFQYQTVAWLRKRLIELGEIGAPK